jgi:solute carrier family 25 (mitochondrial citrate transporter), member 1
MASIPGTVVAWPLPEQMLARAHQTMCMHGPLHAVVTIARTEGITALWNGVGPTILRNGTNQMCLFWAKSNLDRIYWGKHEGDGHKLSPLQSMMSGFSAACLGPVATGPFDVVKTRLMGQEKSGNLRYKGFLHALVTIAREEGIRAMWKGLLPRLMRIPPGQAIVWAVSDQVVHAYEDLYMKRA